MRRAVADGLQIILRSNGSMTEDQMVGLYEMYARNHPRDVPPASEAEIREARAGLEQDRWLLDTGLGHDGPIVWRLRSSQERDPVGAPEVKRRAEPDSLFDGQGAGLPSSADPWNH